MPKCYCESAGCAKAGGVELKQRALEVHTRKDRLASVKKIQDASQKVLDDRDEDISAYISAMTLSDQACGAPSYDGGRIWGGKPDIAEVTGPAEQTPSQSSSKDGSTYRHRVDVILRHLRDVEQSLDKLQAEANLALDKLNHPTERSDPFPLKSLISAALNIRDELSRVNHRTPSVQESKSSTSTRVETLLAKLKASQTQWIEKARQCADAPHPDEFSEYDTGS